MNNGKLTIIYYFLKRDFYLFTPYFNKKKLFLKLTHNSILKELFLKNTHILKKNYFKKFKKNIKINDT